VFFLRLWFQNLRIKLFLDSGEADTTQLTFVGQIKSIKTRLIEVYNSTKAEIKFELKPDTHEALMKVAGGEKMLALVRCVKRYIAVKDYEKTCQLLEQIDKAIRKGKIADSYLYMVESYELKKSLKAFSYDKSIK
jgi:hypothetical protein